jgi:hypothetical protein
MLIYSLYIWLHDVQLLTPLIIPRTFFCNLRCYFHYPPPHNIIPYLDMTGNSNNCSNICPMFPWNCHVYGCIIVCFLPFLSLRLFRNCVCRIVRPKSESDFIYLRLIYTRTHAHIHTFTRTHIHTCLHTHTHIWILSLSLSLSIVAVIGI